MKKPMVGTPILFLVVLVVLIPSVAADHGNSNAGDASDLVSDLKELPELDMSGMNTDIELIEIDQEVSDSTTDWIFLAHDDAGKKLLIDDIDNSDLTEAEKNIEKKSVRKLWETYPTKFEDDGEKSIDIVVKSGNSDRTVSVPIGHVTRITFDKEKIWQTAKDNENTRLLNAVKIGQPSKIVLSDAENMTVKNITNMRAKKAKESSVKKNNPSPSGTLRISGISRNSFTSGISSSSINEWENTETGLMAWSGSHEPTNPIPKYKTDYTGHNSFAYYAAPYLIPGYQDYAAIAALQPDLWTPLFDPSPDKIITTVMHSIGHYYNPILSEPFPQTGVLGKAPDEFEKYAEDAEELYDDCVENSCTEAERKEVVKTFGWASHYISDLGNPLHTGREMNQAFDKDLDQLLGFVDTHSMYEGYVDANWKDDSDYDFGNIVKENTDYYSMTDPDQSAKNLATFSHAYVDTLYYRIRNNPDGYQSDSTTRMITENCIRATARYTIGFANYCRIPLSQELPAVDFSYAVDANSKKVITFTDTSKYSGTLTSRIWSFEDGQPSVSTDSKPTITFSSGGMKRVKLTVSNENGPDSKSMDVPVDRAGPVAAFDAVRQQYPTVQFISTSQGANTESKPTLWNWAFGDGFCTGDTENPIVMHTYPGGSIIPYKATLVVKNIYGNSVPLTQDVHVPAPAEVLFSYIKNGKIVSYHDDSTSASARLWEFGDGEITTDQNPIHEYAEAKTYDVKLTIQDSNWADQKVLTKQIIISAPPLASFTATPGAGPAPLTVQFNDTSTGNPNQWKWNFGDNSTVNTTQNPLHTYNSAGSFTVSLNATNNSTGSNTTTKVGYIKVQNVDMVGVYKNSTHIFSLRPPDWPTTPTISINWGTSPDLPVTGHWNGDGISEVGVFNTSNHRFSLQPFDWPKNSTITINWGTSPDLPVTGDWNGDGISEVGVFNTSNHRFSLQPFDWPKNSTITINWGESPDLPVTGDWNGDGISEVGVFNTSNHRFSLRPFDWPKNSTIIIYWETSPDLPVTGKWN